MTNSDWVYLNGAWVAADEARVSPFDRGFLFAHSAYEVTAVFNGALIDFDGHMGRLSRTLDGIAIPNPFDEATWRRLHQELLARNQIMEGLIYLHITAGDYGFRDFAGPDAFVPNVFMCATRRTLIGEPARDGIGAITSADERWARRDLKTTQLVSQVLAYRRAQASGAVTAIMHQDGYVTEAASANVWVVDAQGRLMTRQLSHDILPGITRAAVIDQLGRQGIDVVEQAFDLACLRSAREIFTSSAGALIAPIVTLDSAPVGSGRPGPVTRNVQRTYYAAMGVEVSAIDWL